MIRKTVKEFKRRSKSYSNSEIYKDDVHIERVCVETWWFLFIPIYSREIIKTTNI